MINFGDISFYDEQAPLLLHCQPSPPLSGRPARRSASSMRFSETLRFNANPEWWLYYIPYDALKEDVERLRDKYNSSFYAASAPVNNTGEDSSDEEEDVEAQADVPTEERTLNRSASRSVLAEMHSGKGTLAGSGANQTGGLLRTAAPSDSSGRLDSLSFEELDERFFENLEKISRYVDDFYNKLRQQLRRNTDDNEERASRLLAEDRAAAAEDAEIEQTPLLTASVGRGRQRQQEATITTRRGLKKRLLDHYHELGDTINFSHLNRTGFDKILKKHDKYTRKDSRTAFMASLSTDTTFESTEALHEMKEETERVFAELFTNGDTQASKKELREMLRDLIIWERNTLWRDVLRAQRKTTPFHVVKGGEKLEIAERHGVVFRPRSWPTMLAALAFVLVLVFPNVTHSLPVEGGPEYAAATLDAAHRCLALVAGVVLLWALDGVPLYVTSFLILPGSVLLRVFLDEDGLPLTSNAASDAVFRELSSPTLFLIICVYALGAALSKFEIDKLVATSALSRIQNPSILLCSVMFLAVFVSMFVSNVAAPVLLNSVMMPTIDAMRYSEGNRIYVRCLLLGIMVASNIGGFASPISSPQSAVALGLLNNGYKISFMRWMMAAIPQCVVMVMVCFSVLYMLYKPQRFVLPPLPRSSEQLRWPHYVIMSSIVVTVGLWSDHALYSIFGSAGIVAVIPVIVLFGSGILSREDFNNLPWDVVYLVAGGSVLGAAVESCKLLDLVAGRLVYSIGTSNLVLTYVIFCLFMAIVANAVSHTVSAIIVLPLIYKIGVTMGHPQLLVLGGTFAASSAMALPISSFPNISATQVEDEKGEPYLTPKEVLRVGSVMTVLATAVLLTFGYHLMLALKM